MKNDELLVPNSTGLCPELLIQQKTLNGFRNCIFVVNLDGCGDLHLTARDAAKFGLLYLNNGEYERNQVVSTQDPGLPHRHLPQAAF